MSPCNRFERFRVLLAAAAMLALPQALKNVIDKGFSAASAAAIDRYFLLLLVAAAVFALTGGDLSQTTGLHIPVDAGVAAAFLR